VVRILKEVQKPQRIITLVEEEEEVEGKEDEEKL
jgi:hypothetical protein